METRRSRDDRLSDLGDSVLGHILSFLPAKEAARAATLSARWRDVFANVHTISLEEPEERIPDYDNDRGYERNPPPFTATVTAALLARSRHPGPAAAAPPLHALRVAMNNYEGSDSSVVDHWVSYTLKQAAPQLDLDLCLRRTHACDRDRRSSVRIAIDDEHPYVEAAESEPSSDEEDSHRARHRSSSVPPDDDDDNVLLEQPLSPEYTVPRGLFSCAELRSLRIGPCRLCPPPTVSLPSIEVLALVHVSDEGDQVQRFICACPRLVDLTLEACDTITALSLPGRRLRKLSVWCCYKLASIAIDVSMLLSFAYRGGVPHNSFLAMQGSRSIMSCKVDICGEQPYSEEELTRLGDFLHLFVSTKHLYLRSARLGSCFLRFPTFSSLQHLEIRGRVPHDDLAIIDTVSRILRQAPNLHVLSLVFETAPQRPHSCMDGELLDAHHLEYNHYTVVNIPSIMIPCLRNHMRRINLVHYHGGKAQRTLAKFLLCNALVLGKLYCGFASGPLWIQTKLMGEIEGWAMINPENRIFS